MYLLRSVFLLQLERTYYASSKTKTFLMCSLLFPPECCLVVVACCLPVFVLLLVIDTYHMVYDMSFVAPWVFSQ